MRTRGVGVGKSCGISRAHWGSVFSADWTRGRARGGAHFKFTVMYTNTNTHTHTHASMSDSSPAPEPAAHDDHTHQSEVLTATRRAADFLQSVCFTSDGSTLVAGSRLGRVLVWPLAKYFVRAGSPVALRLPRGSPYAPFTSSVPDFGMTGRNRRRSGAPPQWQIPRARTRIC